MPTAGFSRRPTSEGRRSSGKGETCYGAVSWALRIKVSRQKLPRPLRWRRVGPVSILESIVKDLESLPAPKLVEVAHYVSNLNPKRREERLAALNATAGCLPGAEGEAFEKAVCEEGGRIDLDDWK